MVPLSQRFFLKIFRCRRFVEYELSPFFLRDSRASETRASVKTTPTWGDFHARSRFARSTIPEEKWRQLVVYRFAACEEKYHEKPLGPGSTNGE